MVGASLFTLTDIWQLEVELLSIDVPDIVRSFPTGTCWPLVGDMIFTFAADCDDADDGDKDDGDNDCCAYTT